MYQWQLFQPGLLLQLAVLSIVHWQTSQRPLTSVASFLMDFPNFIPFQILV
jgi:hypothetical protein